jgi:hypothetical protein
MEVRQKKRERQDDNTKETIAKKICNFKEGEIFKIPVNGKLTNKFGTYALCSAEDYGNLLKHSWYWQCQGYPITRHKENGTISMSRFIMEAEKGTIVDHINRDRKDNRRGNLRIVTHSQNAQNRTKRENCSSSYRGVHYDKRYRKFGVRLEIMGIRHNIGYFDDEIDAARAFDTYVVQNREKLDICHPLNFPDDIDLYKKSAPVLLKKRQPKSNFRYVEISRNMFKATITNGKEKIYLGLCATAKEAAKVADDYIVQNNLDKKLNFPEDYPNFNSKKAKIYVTEIDLSDIKIETILKNIGEHAELTDVDPVRDVLIKLGGKNKDKYTIIERSDYEILKNFNVSAPAPGYVKLSKGTTIRPLLSRFLFCDTITKDDVVDHIFSNKLDNRRRFLKVVSISQNSRNRRKSVGKSSKFSGVCKWKDRYVAVVSNHGKVVFKKYMKDDFEAGRLRDLFIIHNYPNDNYYMNFKDWDEDVTKYWTNRLKDHIYWETPVRN